MVENMVSGDIAVVDNAPHIPKVEMSHTLIMKMTKNDG